MSVSEEIDCFALLHLREKVCRLCLEERPKLAELSTLYFDEIHFLDIIRDCFGIEIDPQQSQLPLLICKKCLVATLNFNAFKNTVIENEVFLQNVDVEELALKLHAGIPNVDKCKQNKDKENDLEHQSSDEDQKQSSENEEQRCNEDQINPNIDSENCLHKSSCSICTSFFDSRQSSISICGICNDHKRPGENVLKTTKMSESARIYACSACEKKFSKPSEWKEHMIAHYSTNKYGCLQCNASFESKHQLVVHNYSHMYKNPNRLNNN